MELVLGLLEKLARENTRLAIRPRAALRQVWRKKSERLSPEQLALFMAEVVSKVRVGVAPRAPEESLDAGCTSRDYCHIPTRAGTRIYKGWIDSVSECTMAFHVVCNGGDIEFVTRPATAATAARTTWYIKDGTSDGLLLGAEQKNGESRVYGGSGACPIVGQAACASRGTSNVVDCGTVRTTWTSWVSNTANIANIVVWGGDMNDVVSEPGDSGSPIFDRLDAEHWGTVGVLNTSGGMFAVLCKAESGLAITGKAY